MPLWAAARALLPSSSQPAWPDQNRILAFLRTRVANPEDPRRLGKALAGPLSSVWHYRIGDYRLFCTIDDAQGAVRVLRIGRRDEVYR